MRLALLPGDLLQGVALKKTSDVDSNIYHVDEDTESSPWTPNPKPM